MRIRLEFGVFSRGKSWNYKCHFLQVWKALEQDTCYRKSLENKMVLESAMESRLEHFVHKPVQWRFELRGVSLKICYMIILDVFCDDEPWTEIKWSLQLPEVLFVEVNCVLPCEMKQHVCLSVCLSVTLVCCVKMSGPDSKQTTIDWSHGLKFSCSKP